MENPGLAVNRNYGSPWGPRDQQQQQQQEQIVIINEQQLQIFVYKVYFFGFLLCLMSAIPWIVLSSLKIDVVEETAIPPWTWGLLALIVITILWCTPQTAATAPIYWALVLVIVFFVTFWGACFVHYLNILVLSACLLISIILVGLLHIYGAKAPAILLPNVLCQCAVFLLGMITMITFIILFHVTGNYIYRLAVAIVVLIILISTCPLQAMYNCGRLNYVPINETPGCAFAFYFHFVAGTACLFIIAWYHENVNK
ncbi:hypothetical protein KR074_004359 [Drosophila pseudoananassae]|nr:hypothetical protein KR074_004359 [Drosophila pseudoananassae]